MRLLIVDGNSVLHRAYYALPDWRNRSGEATAGVYGFLSMLLKIIEEIKPTHLTIVFDAPGETFRNKLYVAYQAKREKDEEIFKDIYGQIDKLKIVFEKLGVPVLAVTGVEADDTIGSLCELIQKSEVKSQSLEEIVVVTGDRDLMQLVNDKVKLLMPQKGLSDTVLIDRDEVKARLGVWPEQVVDYKALVGDGSDGYPGVVGIGPKGAIELIEKFGTLEEIYRQFSILNFKFSNKLLVSNLQFSKLMEGREGGELSKKLAKIKTDVKLDWQIDKAILPRREKFGEIFKELGHKSLLKRLTGEEVKLADNQPGLFD